MATGNKNYSSDQPGIPLNWAEAEWPVDVDVRSRRFAAELVQVQPRDERTRGRSAGGARIAHDAWLIWRTSQTRVPSRKAGFTLIELLVVIAVIAILAGLLLPTLMGVKIRARVKVTKSEINNLAAAISQYESEYSRPPLSKTGLNEALRDANLERQDFTYGGTLMDNTAVTSYNTALAYKANNSELIAILQKENQAPNQNLQDLSKAFNPRQIQFFDKKRVDQADVSGIGPDNVFRDAWGNPYFITIDVNDDGVVFDGFYTGIYARDGRSGKDLGIRAKVAIWSAGPDLKASSSTPSKQLVNRDNIVSWE